MENMFENQQYSSVFNQKNVRKQFTKKVFSLVGIQLFVTFMIVSLFRNVALLTSISNILFFPCCLASFVISIALSCFRENARTYPKNYYLLGAFTFCEAIMLENFLKFYDSEIIFQAGFMTALTVGFLGAVAQFSNFDFTTGKSIMILLGAQFVFFIFGFIFFSIHSVLYSLISILIFCAYTVVDLQMIMGDKQHSLRVDDYVLASIILYTDIIQIFIKLVNLLSDSDDKKNKRRRN